MEALAKHYNVGKEEDLYCLDDIASNIIKTNRKSLYMSKITERHKINGKYYVTELTFKNILKKARSETGQQAYEMYFQFVNNQNSKQTNDVIVSEITTVSQTENTKKILSISNVKKTNQNLQCELISHHILYDEQNIHVLIINNEYWFSCVQICKILGYQEPTKAYKLILKEFTSEFSNLLKLSPNWTQLKDKNKIKNIQPNAIYISYPGLYQLCTLSKKPNAKPFQLWIFSDVIPSIIKTGSYTLKEYEEVPLQLPLLPHNIDINDYINKSCIYFIHIKQNLYKVGWTHKILDRFTDHKKNYDYQSVIKVFQLENNNDCSEIEGKIKRYLKDNNILANHQTLKKIIKPDMKNSTEIFEITDKFTLQHILNVTQHYLSDLKEEKKKQQIINGQSFIADNMLSNHDIPTEVKLKRLEIEAESRKHDFELHKLQLQLQIELAKVGKTITQTSYNNFDQFHLPFEQTNEINSSNDHEDKYHDDDSDNESQLECPESPTTKLPIHIIPFKLHQTEKLSKSPVKSKQIEKPPKKVNCVKQSVQPQKEETIDLLSEIDEFFEEIEIEQPKATIESKPKKPTKKTTAKIVTPNKQTTQTQTITQQKVEIPRSKFAILQNIQKPKKEQKETTRTNECCSVCKNPLTAFGNRCDYCPSLKKFQEAIVKGNRPSFLTIKKDLETMSMVAVGKKYDVSDNCIKKWLNKYVKYGLTNN